MNDDAILGLGFFGLFVLIPFLIGTLRHSRAFWVPGAVLFLCGIAVMGSIKPAEDHGSPVDAIGALGDGIAYLFALFLFGYAVIALCIGAASRARFEKKRRTAAMPPQLPVATAVAGVNGR